MSYVTFENQYFDALKNILKNGTVCVSGRQTNDQKVTRTKRVWGTTFHIDLQKEFPLLRSKHVAVKSACREILWIMQKQSNNINDLIPHIWDKWADENGSIGATYGYQVGKPTYHKIGVYDSQVHYVLDLLKKDPSSRHGVISMWDPNVLDKMNCIPCCYTCHFAILDGKLNLAVFQRSADMLIGVPFNVCQYAFLLLAFARHLGVGPGTYIHTITDAHIYEDQYGNFDTGEMSDSYKQLMFNYEDIRYAFFDPEVKFDDGSTSFWDITDHNFEILNYEIGVDCCDDIPFPVTE